MSIVLLQLTCVHLGGRVPATVECRHFGILLHTFVAVCVVDVMHRTSHKLVHNLVPQNPYIHDMVNGARIDYISEIPVNRNKSFT